MKKIIASPQAPKAVGPYSQAVETGGTLYVSGQLPIDAATGRMAEGVEAQTRQSLTNCGHERRLCGVLHGRQTRAGLLRGGGPPDGRAGRDRRRSGEINHCPRSGHARSGSLGRAFSPFVDKLCISLAPRAGFLVGKV